MIISIPRIIILLGVSFAISFAFCESISRYREFTGTSTFNGGIMLLVMVLPISTVIASIINVVTARWLILRGYAPRNAMLLAVATTAIVFVLAFSVELIRSARKS
ncbi:MAG: hypothetical protein ABJC26_03130 [Gemmatimonadaceae bacterium]